MLQTKPTILIVLLLFVETLVQAKSRYWITSCELSGCFFNFNSCLNCIGEDDCKECISNVSQICSVCANDIFNENYLETIDGNKYLICDSLDSNQAKVCHLYCRGNFWENGQCVRIKNIPVCQCSPKSLTTSLPETSSTTKLPSTPSVVLSDGFNGTLKFMFSTPYGYQKFFPLPSGDIVRGSIDNYFEIWSTEYGIMKRKISSDHNNPTNFGLLSNGDLAVGYSSNNTILVWDLNVPEDEALKRIVQTNESIQYIAVLRNDDLAISQNQHNFDIVVRSSQNGTIKKRMVGHTGIVNHVIELPNGNLVSCSSDKTIKEWSITDGSLLKSINLSNDPISMKVLKDGNLAVGLSDGRINIWNLEYAYLVTNLIGNMDRICYNDCMHVLQSGDLLSASYDRTLKIWNVDDGSVKNKYGFLVHQLAILPSGNLIGSSSIQILIWN